MWFWHYQQVPGDFRNETAEHRVSTVACENQVFPETMLDSHFLYPVEKEEALERILDTGLAEVDIVSRGDQSAPYRKWPATVLGAGGS